MTSKKEILSLIKYAYFNALELSQHSLPISALSVLLCDDIIEWVLNVICTHKNINCKNLKIKAYLEKIKGTLTDRQLAKRIDDVYKPLIVYIRDVRNKLKHEGVLPSQEEVEKVQKITFWVLRNLIEAFFDYKWSELSLVSFISIKNLRDKLQQIESYINNKDYKTALRGLASVFEEFIGMIDQKLRNQGKRGLLVGPSINLSAIGNIKDKNVEEILFAIAKKLRLFENLQIGLCISPIPSEFIQFWMLTPWAQTDVTSKQVFTSEVLYEPTEKEVLFCFDFIVDLILRWQNFLMKADRVIQ
ncbi:MAG TPA: hypothetical protein ENG66_01255 [Thermococcus sp.]|nr:MAG: hypothetical protein DRP25_00705 [Thermotoga sp.]HDH44023.1 hypothetical protein [Thermococcus sp.]